MSIGYDKLEVNQNLVLDLQFREGTGTRTRDWAKPAHPNTPNANFPAWSDVSGLPILDFVPNDWIKIANADSADLDFTTGDFSIAIWVNARAVPAILFSRGVWGGLEGYTIFLGVDASLTMETNDGVSNTISSSGPIFTTGSWHLITITRSGTSVRVYYEGVDVTVIAASHPDIATSTEDVHIGILEDEISAPFDGLMWRPRVWNGALSPLQQMFLYERDRGKFGV